MKKTKTNISVVNNVGIRRNASMHVGDNGPYPSGDILDANAVNELVNSTNTSEILNQLNDVLNSKQDNILDLDTIRSGAAAGATAQLPATTLNGYGITDGYTKTEGQALESSIDGRLEAQDATIALLNGSEVIVVADHTVVATPDSQKIYREQGSTSYTDWMYQNSEWKKIAEYDFPGVDDQPTSGSENLVKSEGVFDKMIQSGVFDLSAHTGDSYADLSAALTAMNALPAAYKKGGMSIKFVQSSDNKYVQYRLVSDSFNTTPSNWQGIDDEPTAGSDNLVKSGGVKNVFDNIVFNLSSEITDYDIRAFALLNDGTYTTGNIGVIPVSEKEMFVISNIDSSRDNVRYAFVTSDEMSRGGVVPLVSGTSVLQIPHGTQVVVSIPAGCSFLVFNAPTTYQSKIYRAFTDKSKFSTGELVASVGIGNVLDIDSNSLVTSGVISQKLFGEGYNLLAGCYWGSTNIDGVLIQKLYKGLKNKAALPAIPAKCKIVLNEGYSFRQIYIFGADNIVKATIDCAVDTFIIDRDGYVGITIGKTNSDEEIDDITNIIKELSIGHQNSINLIDYAKPVSVYVNSNNIWQAVGSAINYNMLLLPVTPGHNVYLSWRETTTATGFISFLKTYKVPTVGENPDFSDEYPGRVSVPRNTFLKIPQDTNAIYCQLLTSSIDVNIYDFDGEDSNLIDIEKNRKRIEIDVDALSIFDVSQQYDEVINLLAYPVCKKYISAQNIWDASANNLRNIGILVPVKAGYTYNITASRSGTIYALLKSDTPVTEPVDFSDSAPGRIVLSSLEEVSVTIPNDTHFLYFFKSVGYADYLPNSLSVQLSRIKAFNNVVFMGDSITHGVYSYWNEGIHDDNNRYNGFDLAANFSQLTNEEITEAATAYHGIHYYFSKMANCNVVNLARRGSGFVQDGRSGGTFLDLIEGNPNKTKNGIPAYDFSETDLVIICLGINDYIQGRPIGDVSAFNQSGEYTRGTIIGNLAIGVKEILSQNPLCKILVCSPYNSFGQVSKGGDYTSDVTYGSEATNYALGISMGGGTLQQYIDAIDSVCSFYGIQHLPLSKSNVCNRITLKNIMIDGLHPSKESYIKLAAEIYGKCNFGD